MGDGDGTGWDIFITDFPFFLSFLLTFFSPTQEPKHVQKRIQYICVYFVCLWQKNHACVLWAMLTSTYYLNQTSPNCNRTSSTHFHFHTFPSPLSLLSPGPFLLYFTSADGIGIHPHPLYPILSYPLFFSSLSLSLCLFILFHDRHRAHLHAKKRP